MGVNNPKHCKDLDDNQKEAVSAALRCVSEVGPDAIREGTEQSSSHTHTSKRNTTLKQTSA